jgi:hypothetical protein
MKQQLEYAYNVARLCRLREQYANVAGVRKAQVKHRINTILRTLAKLETEDS